MREINQHFFQRNSEGKVLESFVLLDKEFLIFFSVTILRRQEIANYFCTETVSIDKKKYCRVKK